MKREGRRETLIKSYLHIPKKKEGGGGGIKTQ